MEQLAACSQEKAQACAMYGWYYFDLFFFLIFNWKTAGYFEKYIWFLKDIRQLEYKCRAVPKRSSDETVKHTRNASIFV
jgi:hypothetical protein